MMANTFLFGLLIFLAFLWQMRRPSKPMNNELRGLAYNIATSLYDIVENGITYSMPLELTRTLKIYCKSWTADKNNLLLDSWYNHLPKVEKKLVIRRGRIAVKGDDFFPDPDFD